MTARPRTKKGAVKRRFKLKRRNLTPRSVTLTHGLQLPDPQERALKGRRGEAWGEGRRELVPGGSKSKGNLGCGRGLQRKGASGGGAW